MQPADEGQAGGGSNWNNSLTRRRFLKRTGGATAATLISFHLAGHRAEGAVSASTGGSTEWEYTLHCIYDPTMQTDLAASLTGGSFSASKTETWDSGDNSLTVSIKGSGPRKGDKSDSFSFSGKVSGKQDADADGGGEIVGEWSDDGSTGSSPPKENGVTLPSHTLEIYMDGTTPKCRWTPGVLSVPEDELEAYDPWDDDDVLEKMKISGTTIPAARMGGGIAAVADGVSWGAGATCVIGGFGGGANFSITYPSQGTTVKAWLTWDFEIVKRPKGSNQEWQSHGPISIANQITGP